MNLTGQLYSTFKHYNYSLGRCLYPMEGQHEIFSTVGDLEVSTECKINSKDQVQGDLVKKCRRSKEELVRHVGV